MKGDDLLFCHLTRTQRRWPCSMRGWLPCHTRVTSANVVLAPAPCGWEDTPGAGRRMHRVIGPMHRVIGPMHRVIGQMHRVIGPMHRVIGPMHRVIGQMHRVDGTIHAGLGDARG